jgi:hypothetical protein
VRLRRAAIVLLGIGMGAATIATVFAPLSLADGPTTLPTTIAAATMPTENFLPVAPAGFGPIDYFENSCARCHGDYGSNYIPASLAKRNAASMTTEVAQMAAGPGRGALTPEQTALESAFHMAMAQQKPFVCVTAQNGDTITGEATPGTHFELQSNGVTYPVKPTSDYQWTATVPNADLKTLSATVTPAKQAATKPS